MQPRHGRRLARGLVAVATCVLAAGSRPAAADVWYVSLAFGGASTSTDQVALHEPTRTVVFTPVAYDARSFESPLYYSVRFGHEGPVFRRFGLEAELTHLKAYADVDGAFTVTAGTPEPMSSVVESFSMSHGMNLLLGNIVFRQPIGSSAGAARVRVTARAGLGVAIPHAESTVRGVASEGYELAGVAYQLGAGLEWVVARRVFLLGEYRWTHAAPDVTVAGGTAKTTIATQHVNVGAGFRF